MADHFLLKKREMLELWLVLAVCLCLSSVYTNSAEVKVFRFDYDYIESAEGWMKFHIVPGTWTEARLRCHAEGAVLASPLTNQLKKGLIEFVVNKKGPGLTTIFTGIHASFSKGDYSSIEGIPLTRLPITWAAGEPDNFENAESCLAMTTDNKGSTSDVRCASVLPYVCYKKYTQLSMTACGTTDPEYVLEPRTGSCYKFHEERLVWSEAYMTCVAEGGYLADINNAVEAEVVKEIFSRHPKDDFFLLVGFHDWHRNGSSFMTIHGENLKDNYDIWGEGQPDNITNPRTGDLGQFCGCISRKGLLDDYHCNVPDHFICEKNPNSLLGY